MNEQLQQARQKLWADIYAIEWAKPPETAKETRAAKWADHAVHEFDRRFKAHPTPPSPNEQEAPK